MESIDVVAIGAHPDDDATVLGLVSDANLIRFLRNGSYSNFFVLNQ